MNLSIGDSQQGLNLLVWNKDLEDDAHGAVTVANLNDTDGDGRVDKDDTFVKRGETTLSQAVAAGGTVLTVGDVEGYKEGDLIAIATSDGTVGEVRTVAGGGVDATLKTLTLAAGVVRANGYPAGSKVYHAGRDEVDLMGIILWKPTPDNGGNVTLKVVCGDVIIWQDRHKGVEIPLDGNNEVSFPTGQLNKTLWVEARSASVGIRDIHLRLTYGQKWDAVKATAAWVNKTQRSPWHTRVGQNGLPNNPIPGPAGDLKEVDPYLSAVIEIVHKAADGSRYGIGWCLISIERLPGVF